MLTTFLTAVLALLVGGIGGAFLAWRPLNNSLIVARAERRAAQKRCADLQAQRDRLAHDGVALRGLAAEFYASWAECDADADVWWERYTTTSEVAHDLAIQLSAAQAHDAEVIDEPDPFDVDLPALAAVAAACPVSPAPAWDFTGSWKLVDTSRALEATPAYVGAHRMQDAA